MSLGTESEKRKPIKAFAIMRRVLKKKKTFILKTNSNGLLVYF